MLFGLANVHVILMSFCLLVLSFHFPRARPSRQIARGPAAQPGAGAQPPDSLCVVSARQDAWKRNGVGGIDRVAGSRESSLWSRPSGLVGQWGLGTADLHSGVAFVYICLERRSLGVNRCVAVWRHCGLHLDVLPCAFSRGICRG